METTIKIDKDLTGIEEAIMNYFYGVKEGNITKIKKAFLDTDIHMKGIMTIDGKLEFKIWENGDLINSLHNAVSNELVGNIISINVYSKNAAFALFNFNNTYTDAFQLFKINDEWKIINKAFVEID